MLELLQQVRIDISDRPYIAIVVCVLRHRDETIVADPLFPLIFLLGFNDANECAGTTQPANADWSIKSSTSIGSPSGALVWGTKPKS